MATNDNENNATPPASTETPAATPGKRVWVRILRSGVHAEGGRFRAGARVQVNASIADAMVKGNAAVKLADYY